MKKDKYQKRFYREGNRFRDLFQAQVAVQETDLQILADRPLDKDFCKKRVGFYRRAIEGYVSRNPKFLVALKPLAIEPAAPAIVKKMGVAAEKAGVGPMAAVAGAIAEFLGEDLLKKGYREVIIENGGDIFLKIAKPRAIGIYAGSSMAFNRLYLKIAPRDTPLGICTSSATVGHSLSFGLADAAVILARDAALADAVATASANRVKSKGDLEKALAFVRSVKGVSGAVIIFKKYLISWGNITLAA